MLEPMTAINVSTVVTDVISSIGDYMKTREVQKTERERVKASLKAITLKLETDREKFQLYLEHSFSEREKLYQRFDQLLKKSMELQDVELSKLALNAMLTVYSKNALEGFDHVSNGQEMTLLQNGVKNFL